MAKRSSAGTNFWIIFLVIVFVLVLTILAGFVFYTQFKGEKARNESLTFDIPEKNKDLNAETENRIRELENKLKALDTAGSPLTQDQISAVVELWCPDDNYDTNGFLSMGSGTIISNKGIIFTNRHVVSNEDWSVIKSSPTCYVGITEDISQPSKFKYVADILAYSPQTPDFFDFDVAVLYIYDVCKECPDAASSLPKVFPYLETGQSAVMGPGDYVSIIGYPEIGASTWNFTDGIISGRVGDFVLKTDAKIDSGNSGGAALDSKNQLIGIPTWTISGQAETIGYIIGIDMVYEWFEEKVLPFIENS